MPRTQSRAGTSHTDSPQHEKLCQARQDELVQVQILHLHRGGFYRARRAAGNKGDVDEANLDAPKNAHGRSASLRP